MEGARRTQHRALAGLEFLSAETKGSVLLKPLCHASPQSTHPESRSQRLALTPGTWGFVSRGQDV